MAIIINSKFGKCGSENVSIQEKLSYTFKSIKWITSIAESHTLH